MITSHTSIIISHDQILDHPHPAHRPLPALQHHLQKQFHRLRYPSPSFRNSKPRLERSQPKHILPQLSTNLHTNSPSSSSIVLLLHTPSHQQQRQYLLCSSHSLDLKITSKITIHQIRLVRHEDHLHRQHQSRTLPRYSFST